MGDVTGPILVVTSWVANFRNKKKNAKMSSDYNSAKNLLFFRPAESSDIPTIIKLEVRILVMRLLYKALPP